jgi:hypothetical protein
LNKDVFTLCCGDYSTPDSGSVAGRYTAHAAQRVTAFSGSDIYSLALNPFQEGSRFDREAKREYFASN